MRRNAFVSALVIVALLAPAALSYDPKSGPRPEVWLDFDMENIAEPEEYKDALYWDFFRGTFKTQFRAAWRRIEGHPAWNVNAWDEVPDSSWYTNRNHLKPMTAADIARGPNEGPGPDTAGVFTILQGKTAGTSPGFGRTRDSRGNVYFIKFDSSEHPELSTAAEIIGSRLFHAMGFSVPQEWIVAVRGDQFRIDEKATMWDEKGTRRKLMQADVDKVLSGAARLADGRYRAVFSLLVSGKFKGFFLFEGTREDDPNDLVPHQHRRDLRGLRLMSAWLNHYDIRVGNTMDMYVEEEGRKFLRHYLLDFGSTLGSASYFPKLPRMGNSYLMDFEQMFMPLISLGVYQPKWRDKPVPIKFPTIGPFESERFDPMDWRPVFHVPAFSYMERADAYWAAKVVMSFTEEQIRAAVRTAELSSREAEEYLVRTLIERQRKIARLGLASVTPLDRFNITGSAAQDQELEFEDLAATYGFVNAGSSYYWYAVGNGREAASSRTPRIPVRELLRSDPGGNSSLPVVIGAIRDGRRLSQRPVRVYLERQGSGYRVRAWEH